MSMELVKGSSIVVTIPNSEAVVKNQLEGIEDRTVGMFYTNDNGAKKEEILDFFNNFSNDNVYQIDINKTIEYSKYVTKHIYPLEDKFKYGLTNYKENIAYFKSVDDDYLDINSLELSENNNSRYLKFSREDDISKKFYGILLGDISTLVITKVSNKKFIIYPSIQVSCILGNSCTSNETECEKVNYEDKEQRGINKIYYGAPGCGKSYKVKKNLDDVGVLEENRIRTVFHPEYANCDFAGQIMPKVDKNGGVTYEFNPGPFTLAIKRALKTNEMVYLIIEEINRGNAAAIFGDLFQLLDRKKDGDQVGRSEYDIVNHNIEQYLIKSLREEGLDLGNNYHLFIPSNLTILATMNSSDQNVFTLDTAFKRRWYFEQIDNDILNDNDHQYKNWYVPGTELTWQDFMLAVNKKILKNKIQNQTNEDKRMGKYFVTKDCLVEKIGDFNEDAAKNFAYKVLEYLWNDVCKIGKEDWFETELYETLEDLVNGFIGNESGEPLSIFKNYINLFGLNEDQ